MDEVFKVLADPSTTVVRTPNGNDDGKDLLPSIICSAMAVDPASAPIR